MIGQESITSIDDWVKQETEHVDLVASWESLCDTYDSLRFTDRLSDAERMEEFRWIVQQMNSFLTKIRTKMLSCKDKEAMLEMLGMCFVPSGKMDLTTRRALAYQKLRQQWIRMEVATLSEMMERETEDGWTE